MDQRNDVQDFNSSSLSKKYRVLPLNDKLKTDQKKRVSLQSNKCLASKWQEYKDNIVKKRMIPLVFPHASDCHFYNNQVFYKPSESINKGTDFRYTLVAGPGVDEHGVIPIPNELHFKSTVAKPNRKSVSLIKKKKKKKMTMI